MPAQAGVDGDNRPSSGQADPGLRRGKGGFSLAQRPLSRLHERPSRCHNGATLHDVMQSWTHNAASS